MTFNVPPVTIRAHSLPIARQKPIESANAPPNPITRKVLEIIGERQTNSAALRDLQSISNASRRNTTDIRAHRSDIETALSELRKTTGLGFHKSLLLGELQCQQQKAHDIPHRFDIRTRDGLHTSRPRPPAQDTPTAAPTTREVSALVARRRAALEGTSPARRPEPLAPAASRLAEALRKERNSTQVNEERVYGIVSMIVDSLGVNPTDKDGANSREALQSAIDRVNAYITEFEGFSTVVVRARYANDMTMLKRQLTEQIQRHEPPMERAMRDFETWFSASKTGLEESDFLSEISGFCLKRLLELHPVDLESLTAADESSRLAHSR